MAEKTGLKMPTHTQKEENSNNFHMFTQVTGTHISGAIINYFWTY